jgi:hypothetical protein
MNAYLNEGKALGLSLRNSENRLLFLNKLAAQETANVHIAKAAFDAWSNPEIREKILTAIDLDNEIMQELNPTSDIEKIQALLADIVTAPAVKPAEASTTSEVSKPAKVEGKAPASKETAAVTKLDEPAAKPAQKRPRKEKGSPEALRAQVSYIKSAYSLGRKAAAEGLTEKDNPYRPETPRFHGWNYGLSGQPVEKLIVEQAYQIGIEAAQNGAPFQNPFDPNESETELLQNEAWKEGYTSLIGEPSAPSDEASPNSPDVESDSTKTADDVESTDADDVEDLGAKEFGEPTSETEDAPTLVAEANADADETAEDPFGGPWGNNENPLEASESDEVAVANGEFKNGFDPTDFGSDDDEVQIAAQNDDFADIQDDEGEENIPSFMVN